MTAQITRLALTNWRNFKSVDVELGLRVFVVGPNASGKTNLLDAIGFLRDIAAPGGGLQNALERRRGLRRVRSLHGSRSEVRVEVDVRVDESEVPWTYVLEIAGEDARHKSLRVVREEVRRGETTILARPTPDEKDPLLLTQTYLEQVSRNRSFGELAAALASIQRVHVVPQVARTPLRAEELSASQAPGSDFIDQLAQLPPKERSGKLRRLERRLRIAVPKFSKLSVGHDTLGRPHLEVKFLHWRAKGASQNEQEFSDGTLRLIGLLWAIESGDSPILVEEPEVSLHEGLIRQLPRVFAQATAESGRQVIVSTHSERMLGDRGIDPSEILILVPTANDTKILRGDQKRELVEAARAGSPLGEMVTALTRPAKIEQLVLPFEKR